ncbi:MAG: hypothetical protein JOZ96_28175 [Acidobacteria bacterium]|nr:hypothetical protein [Acidobacteriota bacterium]
MRHARQTSFGTRPSVVRSLLTAALLLCVLAGALPAEAFLNEQDSVPACCRGMKGKGGECHGDSCPMHLPARAKTAAKVRHDPVCGAARVLRAAAVGTPPSFRKSPTQESAGAASLTKPCPSECGGAAVASFASPRRQRQAATLSDSLRPRPPTSETQGHVTSPLIKITSALRKLHPTRAPPDGLDSRTA